MNQKLTVLEQLQRLSDNRTEAEVTLRETVALINEMESSFPSDLMEQDIYWENLDKAHELLAMTKAYLQYVKARAELVGNLKR